MHENQITANCIENDQVLVLFKFYNRFFKGD